MAIELKQVYPAGSIRLDGGTKISLPAGRKVEFKAFSGGDIDKFFETQVPVGKKWDMSVNISIVETNM